jgi:uncharacterized membrane protein YgcG
MPPLTTNFRTLRRLALATIVAGVGAFAAAPSANALPNQWSPLQGLSPTPDHVRGYETGGANIYAWTEGDGIYRADLLGLSWSSYNAGLQNIPGAMDIRTVYTGGPDVLAGTSAGLFKNSGGSWTPVAQGPEDDPKNPKKLNVAVQALFSVGPTLLAGGHSSGVFRSNDGGATWVHPQPGNGIPSATTVWQLTSFAPGGPIYAATSSGLFVSLDTGATWTALSDGLPGTVLRVFADGANPNIYYAATVGGGVYRSITLGATWHPLNGDPGPHQLGANTVRDWYQFTGTNAQGKAFTNIYAATDNGLWVGTVTSELPVGALGGSIKWRHVTETGLGGHDIFWALKTFIPQTPGRLLAGTDGGGGYEITLVPPDNTVIPSISGTVAVGSTLTANKGTWTGTADISYEYQWQRCSSASEGSCTVNIPDATSSTYVVQALDEAKWLRVVVKAENAFPTFVPVEEQSNVTGQVGPDPANIPGSNSRPAAKVTGDAFPQPGKTLTAAKDLNWTPTSPAAAQTDSYTFQWYLCDNTTTASCKAIPGALSPTYVIKESEVGKYHRALSYGHNETGSAPASNLSGYVNIVFPPDPEQLVAPARIGNPVVGETIVGNVGAWKWQGTTFKRSWEICNAQGQSCGSISNPNATYKPTNDDIGDTVRIRLTVDSNSPNIKPDPVEVIVGPSAPIQAAPVADNGGGGGGGGTGGGGGGTGGGGGGTGGGGGGIDTVLPTLKTLGLAKKKVKVGGTLQLRYDLSEPGSLQIRIDQLINGRKKGKKCSTSAKKGKKCVIMKKKGTITLKNLSGKGTAKFKAAIGKKKLARGNYEAIVVPIDAAGNKGKARSVKFTVTKK